MGRKLLLRPIEAAEMLGLSRAQVYSLCSRGDLPSVRMGASVRLPEEDVLRYIERLKSESTERRSGGY